MLIFQNIKKISVWYLMFCLAILGWHCVSVAYADERTPDIGKQDAVNLVSESLATLKKGQDTLRLVGVKLPNLIADNIKFRKIDRQLQAAQEETYPGIDATGKLKDKPASLRELIRLYVSLRLLQEKLILLSDYLAPIENPVAGQLSVQVMDLANRLGRIGLKLHQLVYMVVDAYEEAAPNAKVDVNLKWVEEDVQGPGL